MKPIDCYDTARPYGIMEITVTQQVMPLNVYLEQRQDKVKREMWVFYNRYALGSQKPPRSYTQDRWWTWNFFRNYNFGQFTYQGLILQLQPQVINSYTPSSLLPIHFCLYFLGSEAVGCPWVSGLEELFCLTKRGRQLTNALYGVLSYAQRQYGIWKI